MLDLTGKLGDGWSISMFYFPPEETRLKVKILEKSCKKYGRDFNKLLRIYNIAGVITQERIFVQSHSLSYAIRITPFFILTQNLYTYTAY